MRKTIKRKGQKKGGGGKGWLVNFIRAIPGRPLLATPIERNKTRRNNEDYSASVPEAFDGTTHIIRPLRSRVLLPEWRGPGVERVARRVERETKDEGEERIVTYRIVSPMNIRILGKRKKSSRDLRSRCRV